MINNNKILTVSYGTFSCTLEGFDDSFGTMKAIAEYFRDLASDDRYFGAEPPQPDAEMLTRIAQKEISRKVEAREHEGKIVLSAMAAMNEVDQISPASVTEIEPDIAQAAEEEAKREAEAAAAAEAEAARVQAEADAKAEADAEAERLETERVAAERAESERLEAERIETERLEAERLEAERLEAERLEAEAQAEEEIQEPEAEALPPRDLAVELPEAQAFFAASPVGFDDDDTDNTATDHVAHDEDADVAEEIAPEAPAENSIAAKLERIRAVVSQADLATDEDDFSEDEHAEDFGSEVAESDVEFANIEEVETPDIDAETDAELVDAEAADQSDGEDVDGDEVDGDEVDGDDGFDLSNFSVDTDDTAENDDTAEETEIASYEGEEDVLADLQAASEADDIADALAQSDADDMDDDDVSSILASFDSDETASDQTDDDLIEDDAELVEIEVDHQDTDITEALEAETEAHEDADGETAADENLFDDSIYAEDDAALDDDLDADIEPRRVARVIKVKRADLEAAIAQGDLEEIDDDEESSLSDEDEAELARELAEVEANLDDVEMDVDELADLEKLDGDADADTLFEDATFEEDDAVAAQGLPGIDEGEGDDLTRLMAQADQQMDDEEGKQSRDAFAHLRAAVAAKNADSGLEDPSAEEEEGAYRSDLATVVKPRRPSANSGDGRSERPTATERPAPLKLVAEQRVDTPELDKRGPVRPRRVALQEAAINTELGSFGEFAEDVGATALPDLLEAAAAYMSFVEGREQFSRPQLMNTVRSVEKENFSREDGLRSFGQLLRSGKIEKIKGGRFTVTGDIGYRPDARAAG